MVEIPHSWGKLLAKFFHLCAKWATRHTHAQIWAENLAFLFLAQKWSTGYSIDSSWSPEHSHIKIFEIGQKMTELWAKNACPYMGADANPDYTPAPKWTNLNTLTWDPLYMIYTHKRHTIAKPQVEDCAIKYKRVLCT